MGIRKYPCLPRFCGGADGCTRVCKILRPGFRVPTGLNVVALLSPRQGAQSYHATGGAQNTLNLQEPSYNRPWLPESRCLTGTFRRIASYFLVEAVIGTVSGPRSSFFI